MTRRMLALGVVLIAMLTARTCAAASPAPATQTPPDAPSLWVRHPRQAVIGLPLPMEYWLHGPARIIVGNLLDNLSPLEVGLISPEREIRVAAGDSEEVYHRPPHEPTVTRSVQPALETHLDGWWEVAEFAVDLTARDELRRALPAWKPGRYRVEVRGPFAFVYRDDPHLELLAPNPEERRFLEALDRVHARIPRAVGAEPLPPLNWNRWRTFIVFAPQVLAGIDVGQFSAAGRAQLAYHLILAELVHSPKPLAELTLAPSAFENLIVPAYELDLLCLRFELERARDDKPAGRITRDGILPRRPDARLDWLAEGGIIQEYRDLRQRLTLLERAPRGP